MTDLAWPKIRKLLRAPNIGFNAEVYRHFRNENLDPADVGGRTKVRDFCLIGAKDSRSTALSKIQFFRDQVQRAHLKPDIYGIPVSTYHEEVAFHPQVELFFAQDGAAVPEGKSAIQAKINFRLMDESPSTMTEAKATSLANAIKAQFVTAGKGEVFTKGKYLVSYVDKANGYYLQIHASSESEAESVVKKILKVQGHSYDSDRLTLHTPKRNSVNNPTGTQKVYGQNVDKPRWRPTANVRFRYASLKLCGLGRDVILVDTTGHFRDALVRA